MVKTLEDVSVLQYLPNIAGAITSRALFGGTFVREPAPEPAPFL